MFVELVGLSVLKVLIPSKNCTFEQMSINLNKKSNRDTSSKASSFLKLVASFDFIVALVITRDYTLPVTQLLQNKSIDSNHGMHLIQSLKDPIVAIRKNIDFYHLDWYNKALELASRAYVSEAKPRTCGQQNSVEIVLAHSCYNY